MRLVLTSDLHGNLPAIPECDLLIIAGDICPATNHKLGFQAAWLANKFAPWLNSIPARHVIGIAGNHDFIFEKAKQMIPPLRWTYLEDEETILDGVGIYGTPWQPRFFDWAFNADEKQLAGIFGSMPWYTDIVVTHGPPRGCGDWSTFGNEHCGSPSLRKQIEAMQPRLMVCGHIHGGYGEYKIGKTLVVNASHVDESYRPVNPPLVYEMDTGA